MKPYAYYNEFDKQAAAWLRELIKEGLIADGEVDERSITDIVPDDLSGFRQHHFFAGIGGWSYALRLAGWPDDKPVWTGSCPCQPFSTAGNRKGKTDDRHLWPHFFRLIREFRPETIFGEQVASAIRSTGVRTEIENLQSLQSRKTYLNVLTELQRKGGKTLQRLQRVGEEQQESKKAYECGITPKMETREQREVFSAGCGSQSEREGDGIRHNGGMGARDYRQRNLPGYGDTVRSNNPEGMERTIIGQDRQHCRVFDEEHSGGDLCIERDDEYLGAAEDFRSIEWNNGSAQERINRAYREIDESLKRENISGWLDDLQTDLEAEGYAVGHCVLGAHSVNTAHIRQRLYWVADSIGDDDRSQIGRVDGETNSAEISDGKNIIEPGQPSGTSEHVRGVDDSESIGRSIQHTKNVGPVHGKIDPLTDSSDRGDIKSSGVRFTADERLGNTKSERCREERADSERSEEWSSGPGVDWIYCRDNKYRPIKPGIKPLVNGLPRGVVHSSDSSITPNGTSEARVMRLKGYGNAIVPQVAAEFIKAFHT